MISIDQTSKMINDAGWPHGMYGLSAETRPTFFDTPQGKPNAKPVSKEIFLMMVLRGLKYLNIDREGKKPLLLDHADADWREVIKQRDVPALFVAGAESPFWPKEHATASAALCPKGEAAILEGCGYAVNRESPEEFDLIMLDFLRRTGA